MQLGGVFVMALILGYLAPLFGGRNDRLSALKLAGYAATAGWLANVFLLIPWLGFLTLLGLYSLYLISTGAPALLAVPENKALPFTAAFVGCRHRVVARRVRPLLRDRSIGQRPHRARRSTTARRGDRASAERRECGQQRYRRRREQRTQH